MIRGAVAKVSPSYTARRLPVTLRRRAQAHCDQLRFLLPVQQSRHRRGRARLAVQGPLETLQHVPERDLAAVMGTAGLTTDAGKLEL